MYSDGLVIFLILSLGIWLGVVTWFLVKNQLFLNKLFPSHRNGSFKERLLEVLELGSEVEKIKALAKVDLSKYGLVRYNPYGDTGGDQSFSLALLNRDGDGVVVTSLHSRANTRVFAKSVKGSKSEKHEFSEEEEQAIREAMYNK